MSRRVEVIMRDLVLCGKYPPPSWAHKTSFTMWEYARSIHTDTSKRVYQVRYWHETGQWTVTKWHHLAQLRIPKQMADLIVAKLGMEG
jgi:hypothetical protein